MTIAKPAVRLHSISNRVVLGEKSRLDTTLLGDKFKILHLIRHAQGTHNVEADYKNPKHLDAPLTFEGKRQCRSLNSRLVQDPSFKVDCIVTSPMTRAIQTAQLAFEHHLDQGREGGNKEKDQVPLIACEDWRETVNYLSDRRRSLTDLQKQYPNVDFSSVSCDHDSTWMKYEDLFGSQDTWTAHRESNDHLALEKRARSAFQFIIDRPEKSIAVVSHSAFFNYIFTKLENVVTYEDNEVKTYLQERFRNCEIRSALIEILV